MSRHFVVHHVEMNPASVLCTNVKWCSLCISWGDHFRTGHIDTDNSSVDDAADEVPTEGNVTERNVSDKKRCRCCCRDFCGFSRWKRRDGRTWWCSVSSTQCRAYLKGPSLTEKLYACDCRRPKVNIISSEGNWGLEWQIRWGFQYAKYSFKSNSECLPLPFVFPSNVMLDVLPCLLCIFWFLYPSDRQYNGKYGSCGENTKDQSAT